MQGVNVRKFRRRGGFTFAEVLVTLAILGALLAVAIPATVAMARSLKMMELDACARQIAVAVQNNITGMKSAGTLKSFGDKNSGSIGGYCISNGHADVQKILPLGAIDPAVAGKHYTIVYNSATGTVLEVYYAEHSFTVSDALSGMETANVEARKAAKIGYYTGADIQSAPVGTLPQPIVTVENGLDLKVTVTAAIIPMDWRKEAKLTLHVAKEDGNDEVVFGMPSAQVATKILDSLANDFQYRFDYIINGDAFQKKIAPGENLKIWATLDPIEPGKYLPATSNIEYANSLFGAYDLANNEVTIKNSRHLQNLDKLYSGVNLPNTLRATQTENIDWHGGLTFVPIKNDQLTSYNGGTKFIRGLNVTANTSAGLFERFSGQTLTGIRLVNPSVSAGGLTAGALVGTAENVEITDCFAYAEKVNGKWPIAQISGGTAGGLIGSATNCSISYSGAAMPVVAGTTAAGGLIGEAAATTVTSSYADTDNLGANSCVAGFIGNATGKNVKVENCYAVGACYAGKNVVPEEYKPSGFMSGEKRQGDVTVNVKDSYCAMTYLDAKGEPLGLEDIGGFSRLYGTYTNCAYLTPVGATVSPDLPDSKVPEISYADLAARATENAIWTKYPMSHPYRDDLQGKAYPFPALKMEKVGTSAQAKMPHYGSWPAIPASEGGGFLAYYEEYDDRTNGVYYLNEIEKTVKKINTLDNKNDKTIKSTRYGVLLPEGQASSDAKVEVFNGIQKIVVEKPFGNMGSRSVTVDSKIYTFYPFTNATIATINEGLALLGRATQVFVTADDIKTEYRINPNYAAAIHLGNYSPGGTKNPMQVRTQAQLAKVGAIHSTGTTKKCNFLQTHNITIRDSWTAIANFSENYDVGNIDPTTDIITYTIAHTITNTATTLPAPIFRTIESGATVKNVVVADTMFSGDYTVSAADGFGFLARTNNGTVQGCAMKNGKVAPGNYVEKNIVGFIWENTGAIENCIVDGFYLEAPYYGIFTGFANTNRGTIQNSQVKNAKIFGNIGTEKMGGSNAERQIAGFVNINQEMGSITGCSTSDVRLSLTRDASVKVSVAGFVARNRGNITDSHVKSTGASDGTTNVDTINRSLVYSKYEGAVGFVDNNDTGATITGCTAVADVQSDGTTVLLDHAAGFVAWNNGTIKGSTANCVVKGHKASGFARYNDNSIINCTAKGNISIENGDAAGFIYENGYSAGGPGTITGCQAKDVKIVGKVTEMGKMAAGFATINNSGGTIEKSLVTDVRIWMWDKDGPTFDTGPWDDGPRQGLGSAAGFVGTNYGSITNSHVRSTEASDSKNNIDNNKRSLIFSRKETASGFVYQNIATIENCSAVADVIKNGYREYEQGYTSQHAVGFSYDNRGTIQQSYANCAVYGWTGASGFVYSNSGTIGNCYAMGSATAANVDTSASGFAIKSTGTQLQNCYAAVELNRVYPGTVFGFASASNSAVSNCYYVPYGSANSDTDAATAVTSAQAIDGTLLGYLNGGSSPSVWVGNGPAHPFNLTLGKQIPFPSIIGNEHYGDWPTQPIPTGNYMGVFYYENNGNGTYSIDAAALEYEYKERKMSIKGTIPDFLKGNFTAKGTILPPESGYGIFYPQDMTINGSMKYAAPDKEVAIKKLSTDNTFNVEGYYFLPIPGSSPNEDEVKLICEGNPKWEYEFTYLPGKSWVIQED